MVATAILVGAWLIATNINPEIRYSNGFTLIMVAVIVLDFISYAKRLDEKR